MDILADLLTASRVVIVLYILFVGLYLGANRLLLVVALTALAWITDVLDGMFARKSSNTTRLGNLDLVADLGLALALSTCMIMWDVVPLLPAIIIWAIAGAAARVIHGQAPLQLAMAVVYSTLIITAIKYHPFWGWGLVAGLGFLAVINHKRVFQLTSEFLDQITGIIFKV